VIASHWSEAPFQVNLWIYDVRNFILDSASVLLNSHTSYIWKYLEMKSLQEPRLSLSHADSEQSTIYLISLKDISIRIRGMSIVLKFDMENKLAKSC
jgi:hypothetical protein